MRIRFAVPAAAALALLLGATPAGAQERDRDAGCALCHGELELLRRHTETLDDARALVVTEQTVRASAHDTLACGSCHRGFERYPHELDHSEGTQTCASCHQDEAHAYDGGIHALVPVGADLPSARCEDCHGVHDVARADTGSAAVRRRLDGECIECHASAALGRDDPHADTVTCSSCHSAHDTRSVDSRSAQVAPLVQPKTCGACHAEVADSVPHDAHGRALAALGPGTALSHLRERTDLPPTCTSCHGAHGMRAPSHEEFASEMVEACGACHEKYEQTYFGTYHGKATALGSEIVATCDACHGAHSILPADSAHSRVGDARLIDTCADCHDHADAEFALYDSHPDPWDRERNPPLFFSFIFMNAMLLGVLGVFTLHTALWWLRLWLDSRKGRAHPHE